MKKRSTQSKAEWAKTREVLYRKDCEEILLKRNLEILFDDNIVYIKSREGKSFLMEVDQPKSMWYNIWLKLKYS